MAAVQPPAIIICDRGAVAAEFVMVFPALVMFMAGMIYVGLLMYSAAGLQNAVEEGARCYSVNASQCNSAAAAQTYAQQNYYGLSTPKFTASAASCGHQVSATATIALNAGPASWNVPLNATACFP